MRGIIAAALLRWWAAPAQMRSVIEREDELGYFVSAHPFVEDMMSEPPPLAELAGTCPDTVPDWLLA